MNKTIHTSSSPTNTKVINLSGQSRLAESPSSLTETVPTAYLAMLPPISTSRIRCQQCGGPQLTSALCVAGNELMNSLTFDLNSNCEHNSKLKQHVLVK